MLAPRAEVSMFPWKEPKERIPLAIRQIHSFLRAHLRRSYKLENVDNNDDEQRQSSKCLGFF
jgi:hypothetical protein